MNPDQHSVYWCAPARLSGKSGWILYRETVTQVNASGWTSRAAREFPEILAYRMSGERTWKKKAQLHHSISRRDIDHSRRERVPEPEVVAILLMTKK